MIARFTVAWLLLLGVHEQPRTNTEVTFDPTGVVWKPVSKSRSVVFTDLYWFCVSPRDPGWGLGAVGVYSERAVAAIQGRELLGDK